MSKRKILAAQSNPDREAKASNRERFEDDWDFEKNNKENTGKSTPLELSNLKDHEGEPSEGKKTVTTVAKKESKIKTNLTSSQNLMGN